MENPPLPAPAASATGASAVSPSPAPAAAASATSSDSAAASATASCTTTEKLQAKKVLLGDDLEELRAIFPSNSERGLYNYIATSHQPSAIDFSLRLRFFNDKEYCLVIAKSTRLELMTITPEGLVPNHEFSIYGRIIALARCCSPGDPSSLKEQLFVLTESHRFCFLYWDPAEKRIKTRTSGDIKDELPPVSSDGAYVDFDPQGRLLALSLFDGLFKIVPVDATGAMSDAYNLRLQEIPVIDFKFVHYCSNPRVCLLHKTAENEVKVCFKSIDRKAQDWIGTDAVEVAVSNSASMLIAVPSRLGEVLVVANDSILCITSDGKHSKSIVMAANIEAYCTIDAAGSRYLLAGDDGMLYVLMLVRGAPPASATAVATGAAEVLHHVTDLLLRPIGKSTIPSTITYLDNGVVFVGSSSADSHLIKLRSPSEAVCAGDDDSAGAGSPQILDVLDVIPNIGPIVDMCTVDLKRHGQHQVITASGVGSAGSLRIVQSGVGIEEQATLELNGIKGIWSMRDPSKRESDAPIYKYLVLAFTTQTRVMAMVEDDEMAEVSIPGFVSDVATLFCGTAIVQDAMFFVQATARALRLVCAHTLALLDEWLPSSIEADDANDDDIISEKQITVASVYGSQALVALSGGHLVYLELQLTPTPMAVESDDSDDLVETSLARPKATFKQCATAVLEHEVSCIDLHPFAQSQTTDKSAATPAAKAPIYRGPAKLAAVGMWTEISVRLFELPSLTRRNVTKLGGDILPRSLALLTIGGSNTLVVGMGDGSVISYTVMDLAVKNSPSCELKSKRRVVIGSKPVTLTRFRCKGVDNLLAACDRPMILHSNASSRILYSPFNLREEIVVACTFNTISFPDSLAFATASSDPNADDGELRIGTVEHVHRLHTQKVELGETPIRLAHVEHANCFAIATLGESSDGNPACYIRLRDGVTWEEPKGSAFELKQMETACCLRVVRCAHAGSDVASPYLVAGTAFEGSKPHAEVGRILVFEVARKPRDDAHPAAAMADETEAEISLRLLANQEVPGAVYDVVAMKGKFFAAVHQQVNVLDFRFNPAATAPFELHSVYSHKGHLLVTSLHVTADQSHLLIGDLVKAMSLLKYHPGEKKMLREAARDETTEWLLAISPIGSHVFIGCDDHCNLHTCAQNLNATTDEAKSRLDLVGQFHLGHYINTFRSGSLVMRSIRDTASSEPKSSLPKHQSRVKAAQPVPSVASEELIFGCVSGMIGVVIPLSKRTFDILTRVCRSLLSVVKSVGGFGHHQWRAFHNRKRRSMDAKGFVDGDLLDKFLDLLPTEKIKVVNDMNEQAKGNMGARPVSVKSINIIVQEMARLH